mgnify:CR=1 FL=1
MARDAGIERLLLEWAQWLKVGDGSGYPTRCVIHPNWSPPSAGLTPTMKVGSPSTVRRTHRAVLTLSGTLQETLKLHYVYSLSVVDVATRLECQATTVDQGIRTAHGRLRAALRDGGVVHN